MRGGAVNGGAMLSSRSGCRLRKALSLRVRKLRRRASVAPVLRLRAQLLIDRLAPGDRLRKIRIALPCARNKVADLF